MGAGGHNCGDVAVAHADTRETLQKLKIPLSLSSKQPQLLGLDSVLNLCVLTVRRREAVMKVLKQQNLQLLVKLKGSQCHGVMVTVGNGCSHVAGSSQLRSPQ